MRSITWLASDEETTAIMDLTPVAAKAHRLRIQKAAFGTFQLPKVDAEVGQLHGRVKAGKITRSQEETLSLPE